MVQELPHTLDDYRIAAALKIGSFNVFFQMWINLNSSSPINGRLNSKNELQKIVEDKQLPKIKTKFIKLVDSLIDDFPKIPKEYIKTYTSLGSHQLTQAYSY